MFENVTKTSIAKTVAKTVVGLSSGTVVHKVIQNSNTGEESTRERVQFAIGSYALGAMVAECAEAWTDRQIDRYIETWKKITNKDNTEDPK